MKNRGGFTLVELLVTVSIMLVLVVLVTMTLNWSAQEMRIPESARTTASFLEGARDRAIFDRKPVGVRLLLDKNGPTNSAGNPITVSSFLYVHSLDPIEAVVSIGEDQRTLVFWQVGPDGEPGVANIDDDGDGFIDNSADELGVGDDVYTGDEWDLLESRGLLDPRGTALYLTVFGNTFRLVAIKTGSSWVLTRDYANPPASLGQRLNVQLEVTPPKPAVMPNQTPRELARGVVIDLETSRIAGRIPSDWYDLTTESYSEDLDIMFSPAGLPATTVPALVLSLNLFVAEAADIETTTWSSGGNDPFYRLSTRPNAEDERLVTLGMQTGKIGTAEIKLDDDNNNNLPDDPFYYAEVGDFSTN